MKKEQKRIYETKDGKGIVTTPDVELTFKDQVVGKRTMIDVYDKEQVQFIIDDITEQLNALKANRDKLLENKKKAMKSYDTRETQKIEEFIKMQEKAAAFKTHKGAIGQLEEMDKTIADAEKDLEELKKLQE